MFNKNGGIYITKKYNWIIGGFVISIIVVISIITWFYPYSPLSVNQSYAYQPKKVSFNGKSYHEILSDFKESYEEDLNADLINNHPNLTINRTQFILPNFEQDWLISNESVSINDEKLETVLFEVIQVREDLLSLVGQAEYTREQRVYLIDLIRNILSLEDSIVALKNENYLTRSELNRQIDNLYNEFTSNFRSFVAFYNGIITE